MSSLTIALIKAVHPDIVITESTTQTTITGIPDASSELTVALILAQY